MKKTIYALLLSLFMVMPAFSEVITQWLSNAVLPGENTKLFIILTDGQRATPGALPRVRGANLRWAEPKAIYWPGSPRQTAYLLVVDVTADAPGNLTIPSIHLTTNTGQNIVTQPQSLTVYPFDAVIWKEVKIDQTDFQYGVLWHVDNKTPYVNEPVETELKIYAPNTFTKYSLPQLTTSNLASWRFEPALMELGGSPQGSALCKGGRKQVITFKSMIFPLKEGLVTAGGSIEVNALAGSYVDPVWGMTVNNEIPIKLELPELKLDAKALPPGAPADFHNAVGDFSIHAKTDARDLSANDPVSVTITVKGTGNINMISCPGLEEANNWKLYPANKLNPDQNARSITGTVQFQQLLRPIAQTGAIPSFKMSFFDPKSETYKSVSTNPIPLPWKASSIITGNPVSNPALEPPPAGVVPVAKMTDIYAPIPDESVQALKPYKHWSWYSFAYLPALALFGYALIQYIKKNRQQSLASRQRSKAYSELKSAMSEPTNTFLRQIGAYVETYIPAQDQNEDIKKILTIRDELAFTPSTEDNALTKQEKDHMLHSVKKIINKLPLILLSVMCIGALFGSNTNAQTATDFYNQGEYGKAINLYQENLKQATIPAEKANIYYNMGDTYYRLNEPGKAAFNYRKALLIVPNFTEAQANLEFIERKEGAILPNLSTEKQWLTYVHPKLLPPIIVLSSAAMLFFISVMCVYHKKTILWVFLTVLSGLIMVAGILNYSLYPTAPHTLDAEKLLIITKSTPGYTSADIRSAPVITLPPSTPLIFKAKRGSWYYAETFTSVPAWIPEKSAALLNE